MIVYPLKMPATPPGPLQITLMQNFIVGENDSPFTGQGQTYEHPGSFWTAKVDLPAMLRATASPWLAFLAALNGKSGRFFLGDPLATGPIGTAGGSPIVNGAGQSGKQLAISGLTGVLKAGDYFQIGSAGENLLLESQAPQTAPWTVGNVGCSNPTVTGNAIVAPDGTTTAASIAFPAVPNTAGDQAFLSQSFTAPTLVNTPVTLSVWLKVASGTGTIQIVIQDNPATQGTSQNCSLTSSWQRFQVSFTFNGTPSANTQVLLNSPVNSAAVTVHAWGFQLERGNTMNNYIPTLASQIGSTQRLYMNLTDQGPGSVVLDVFPRLRNDATNPNAAPLNGEPLILANPKGLFRLDANIDQYAIETAGFYNISFGAREAF